MLLNFNNMLLCINIFISMVSVIRCSEVVNITTHKTVFIETTTEFVTIITDIPERDVEEALNLDYGRYTTQSFAYFNSQFETPKGKDTLPCFEDHIRCLVTVVVPHPVCAINIMWDLYEGHRTFDTYCDAYLDNCLRRMRFWRIIDSGKCFVHPRKKILESSQTRRKNPQHFKNVFNILANKLWQN